MSHCVYLICDDCGHEHCVRCEICECKSNIHKPKCPACVSPWVIINNSLVFLRLLEKYLCNSTMENYKAISDHKVIIDEILANLCEKHKLSNNVKAT